jgi:hypothetical protein
MFLSGITNIAPGDGVSFTLDRDDLALACASVDTYFADKAVFKEVICSFQQKIATGDKPQRKSLSYRTGQDSSQMVFSSTASEGDWELVQVIVKDFDGGQCKLEPADIPSRNFYDLIIAI